MQVSQIIVYYTPKKVLLRQILFLVDGKPFLILFHISYGFLKYALCMFKATKVRVYKLCIKTTSQMLKHITITLK